MSLRIFRMLTQPHSPSAHKRQHKERRSHRLIILVAILTRGPLGHSKHLHVHDREKQKEREP